MLEKIKSVADREVTLTNIVIPIWMFPRL